MRMKREMTVKPNTISILYSTKMCCNTSKLLNNFFLVRKAYSTWESCRAKLLFASEGIHPLTSMSMKLLMKHAKSYWKHRNQDEFLTFMGSRKRSLIHEICTVDTLLAGLNLD